jgi:hypothetical protein
MQEFLCHKKRLRSRGLLRKCNAYQLVGYDCNNTPPDIINQQGVREFFKRGRNRSDDSPKLVRTDLVLYAGQIECEEENTGEKRRGFVSRLFNEKERTETSSREFSSSSPKKSQQFDKFQKLEYLHTSPLTAAGLRDVLKRVSNVEGLSPTKEALVNTLCRGSLRYRNFTEEYIDKIYTGWAKSTQRLYCNGWCHFADFLLECTAAEIGNLQNKDEVY